MSISGKRDNVHFAIKVVVRVKLKLMKKSAFISKDAKNVKEIGCSANVH